MRIDPTATLELIGKLRYDLAQIPREDQTWRSSPVSPLDTIRAVRALRPRVKELEDLLSQLKGALKPGGGLTLGEQELRSLLGAIIDQADSEGVRTLLLPGQEEEERRLLES